MHDQAVMIREQTERIATIMRQMSSLTNRNSPIAELLDVNELVRATCGFIGYDKRFRNITIDLALDPGIPAVTAVADHLTQILMNLLINAADAMEGQADIKPSTIRISTQAAAGNVLLSVSDNGHGMSPELLAKAFEESFTTKPAGKGRGIGLFLCKTLIEGDGGGIVLESTPDVGSTARLSLPIEPPQTEPA
jgi:two-component system NtrC family sensor kinase